MRILFASMPFDGHFLPLTGLAAPLAQQRTRRPLLHGPGFAAALGGARHPPPPVPSRDRDQRRESRRALPRVDSSGAPSASRSPSRSLLRQHRGPLPRPPGDPRGVPVRGVRVRRRLLRRVPRGQEARRARLRLGPGPRPAPTSPYGAAAVLRPQAGHDRSPGSSTASSARWWRAPRSPAWRRSTDCSAAKDSRPTTRSVFDLPVGRRDAVLPDRRARDGLPAQRLAREPPVRRPPPAASSDAPAALPFAEKLDRFPSIGRGLAGDRRQPRPREAVRARAHRARRRRPPRRRVHRPSIRTPCERASRRTTSSSRTGSTSTAPPARRPLHLQRRLRQHHARADERGAGSLGRQARGQERHQRPPRLPRPGRSTSRPSARRRARSRPAWSACSATRVHAERRARAAASRGLPAPRDHGARHRRERVTVAQSGGTISSITSIPSRSLRAWSTLSGWRFELALRRISLKPSIAGLSSSSECASR